MAVTFTRTGAQIEEIHNTVDDIDNVVGGLTNYQASSIENMIDGKPVGWQDGDAYIAHKAGVHWLTGGSLWIHKGSNIGSETISDFQLINCIFGRDVGIVGDGVSDDSDALELALNFFDNINPSSVFQGNISYILDLSGLKIRYTRQMVQSQGCQIKGDYLQALRTPNLNNDNGTIFYPDFPGSTLICSIVTASYSLSESLAPVGTLIDPWDYKIGNSAYVNGWLTRTYGCSIEGVAFFTDNFLGSPYGAAAAPSIKAKYVHYGFLNAGLFTACWPCDVELYGPTYHRGVMMYNCNDRAIDGYITRFSDVSPAPTLDDTTNPALVISEDPLHNPDSIRNLPCGIYNAFCNAGEIRAVTEKYEKARFYWNSLGTVESGPYIEDIPEICWHHVGSFTTVNSPRMFGIAGGARVSSSGSLVLENGGINNITTYDADSQESFGAVAKFTVNLTNPGQIPDDEKYSAAVIFNFKDPEGIIYVSPTGDNLNTGLKEANAVVDINTAIERAESCGYSEIVIEDGATAEIAADVTANSKITIRPASTTATLSPFNSSGFMRRIGLNSADITIKDLTVSLPSGVTSASSRGLFRPIGGSSKVNIDNCDVSAGDASPCVFTSQSGVGSTIQFSIYGGSINLEHYGRNDTSATGEVTIIFNKSNVTESGALSWGSNFTLL